MSKIYVSLLIADFLLWILYSAKYAQIGLLIIITKYLFDLGIFSLTRYEKGFLNSSEIFYFEFCGDYKNIYKDFMKITNIMEKYSLSKNDWNTFGFYYDNPKTTPIGKCRAIIGIQYENEFKGRKRNLDENIKIWIKEEGFDYKKIDRTKAIITRYPLQNNFSVLISIIKYYSNLNKKLKDKEFIREFNIDDKYLDSDFKDKEELKDLKGNEKINKFEKCIIEIYRESTIEFCVPLENCENLFLYKGLANTLKMN